MLKAIDFSGRPFHFIGIGGIGMSALAYILAERQLPVSGSDLRESPITDKLKRSGVKIFVGQNAANLAAYQPKIARLNAEPPALTDFATDVERRSVKQSQTAPLLPQVICSTAIHDDNAEYQAAIALGCPIFHRSDVLAALIQAYQSVAVAGTHGKTTTSSLISHLFYEAGLDPTVIIGGEVGSIGGNARSGKGAYLVAEADESDGSLVKHQAWIGIVTNIELDHPDHYQSLDQVVEIFQLFSDHCQVLVGCIDCPTVRDRLKPTITYSINPTLGADYTADRVRYHATGTTARIWERGESLGTLELPLLGEHNLKNALSAIAVGREAGLDFDAIAKGIATFEGARRRFEIRGEHHGIRFVDDYAHHPSEIQVTLSAARLQVGTIAPEAAQHRVVAIFQPHRYSRTEAFLDEFAQSFAEADLVILSDIYSAGESNVGRITGEQVADAITAHHPHVYYQPSVQSVGAFLKETLQPGDTALFLGAGNLNQIIPDVMGYFQPVSVDLSSKVS
jgi:UDP-N-acetylmuramate--alanine ligase